MARFEGICERASGRTFALPSNPECLEFCVLFPWSLSFFMPPITRDPLTETSEHWSLLQNLWGPPPSPVFCLRSSVPWPAPGERRR